MAEKKQVVRNDLDVVKTKRGHQWHIHDHMGNRIASSSQYYASSFAARRAAERAAVRMHKWAVAKQLVWATPPNTVARVGEATQHIQHGLASAAIEPKRTEVKPRKRRFGIFGR